MNRIDKLFFALGLALLTPQILIAQTIKFAPPRPISGVTGEPLAGDFDNDGKTDLLTTVGLQPSPRHLNVLFGDGEGGFTTVESNTITNAMSPVLVADVNGDGKSDVIMLTIGCCARSDATIGVFIGDGKGHFTAGAHYSVPYGYYQTLPGDFNNDSKFDFVLNVINGDPRATPSYEKQILFKGHGDGTFTTSDLNLTSGGSIGDDALPFSGDFNGDGNLDMAFVVGNFPGPSYYTANGRGDGTFSALKLIYVADTTGGLPAVADLNGDGKSDMVLSLEAKQVPGAQPRIATLLAKQTEGFYWKSAISLTNSGWAALSDLNGDGKPDLIAYGNQLGGSFAMYLWVYNGLGGGTFGQKSVVNVSAISKTNVIQLLTLPLRRGDLPSIFVVGSSPETLQLLINISR